MHDLGTTPGGSHNPGVTGPLDENITAAPDLPWALNEPLSAFERAGVAREPETGERVRGHHVTPGASVLQG